MAAEASFCVGMRFNVDEKVKGGLYGRHPSLTELEMGNLQHHTDFRQVYAAVLDRWLGVSSRDVLGARFEPAPVFKA